MVMENKTTANFQATITRGRPKDAPLELTMDRVRRDICREPSLRFGDYRLSQCLPGRTTGPAA